MIYIDLFIRKNGRIVMHRIYNKHNFSCNSIHESKNCGLFQILSYEGKNKFGNKLYRIKFLKTGHETVVINSHITDGAINDPIYKNLQQIGKIYMSNSGHKFTIIDYCYKKGSNKYFKIQFYL